NKPYEGSLHLAIKKRFQLDDYYANSAVQQANALRTSQKELQVLYLKQVDVCVFSLWAGPGAGIHRCAAFLSK
ncbi:hypothetical protein ACFFMS_20160, partial [Ectobacillus funiculus]